LENKNKLSHKEMTFSYFLQKYRFEILLLLQNFENLKNLELSQDQDLVNFLMN
jgi:hypothetical protein